MYKRINREFDSLTTNPIEGVSVQKTEDPQKWEVILKGPDNSLYKNHHYKLICTFPDNYPFKFPSLKFETLIWHPRVHSDTGEFCFCCSSIDKQWVPTKNSSILFCFMMQFLQNPTKSGCCLANKEAQFQYDHDIQEFKMNIKRFNMNYCQ